MADRRVEPETSGNMTPDSDSMSEAAAESERAARGSKLKAPAGRAGLCQIIPVAAFLACSFMLIALVGFRRVRCPSEIRYEEPAWSPDGRQIAFESDGASASCRPTAPKSWD